MSPSSSSPTTTTTLTLISLHSLPKDILLRKIAVLLVDHEIIHMAQTSRALLSSLHQAEMRQSQTVQQFIHRSQSARRRSEESQSSLLDALSADEMKILQEDGTIRRTIDAAPALTTVSTLLPDIAIGKFTTLRWRIDSETDCDHTFLLPHLHHLPRTIRSIHFARAYNSSSSSYSSSEVKLDCTTLCLPAHLTELRFVGGYHVPRGEIEKLERLEILEIGMGQLLKEAEQFEAGLLSSSSASPASAPTTASSCDLLLHFPSSLHTLDTSWTIPLASASRPQIIFPSTLTSLNIKLFWDAVSLDDTKLSHPFFPPLPPTLKHLTWSNTSKMNDLLVYLIRRELLPPFIESINLSSNVRMPYISLFDKKEEPTIVWKGAALKTMHIDWFEDCKSPIMPINPTTGVCSITSLTLPERFDHPREYLSQLHEMTTLTYLANFMIDSISSFKFPHSLERLEFSDNWVKSLSEWTPPPKLRAIKFGKFWDIPLTSMILPPTVEFIHFGTSFSRAPPAQYVWPRSLRSVTFSSQETEPHWDTYLKSLKKGVRVYVPNSSILVAKCIQYIELRPI